VSSGAWLEIDLLRQRREQFGHQRPEVVPVRILLLRGALLGAALPLVLLLICGWFWFSELRLIQMEEELTPRAQKYDRLQGEIATEKAVLQSLVNTNKAMAKAMADVRSSSALLSELRRLVPSAVRIGQARINGNVLELDGEALQPNGLRIVNAFMLSLGESVLFQRDAVVLKKAQVQQSGGGDQVAAQRLTYSLTAEFAPDAPQAIRSQLASLGAVGLKERLQRLHQEEDLLP
jgi:Tfp pilus assembly protein PilN